MKTLGLLLSFLGPLFLGLISARGESLRLQRERGMLKLMLHGEEKIRHSLCPRDELFFDFENAALSRCGFLPALKAGARAREEPLGILEKHRRALDLDERVFSSCQRYFSRLGKLDYDSQLSYCRRCREEGEEAMVGREAKGKDRIKLSITLGAAAGAFAVILLL